MLKIGPEGQPARSYVLRPGQTFVLGRGEDVSVHVDDHRVSRRHLGVTLDLDGVLVVDMGSHNGTFLDNQALPKQTPTRVFPGSEVQLGKYVLTFELEGFDTMSISKTQEALAMDAPILPGKEFQLLQEIGHGSGGRVYAARQVLTGRDVAIKVMRWEVRTDSEEHQRFLREARLYVAVKSPYVVELYDIRVADQGRPYMVMELVQGPNARDLIQEGPVSIATALGIGEAVAQALDAAWRVGVIHRDVKPSNILIGAEGQAKLGDFGLAKQMGEGNLTETGVGMGSLPYASPEQVLEARSVDHTSDIYGLGATLYHLIAGLEPFPRGDPPRGIAQMVKIVASEDPPSLLALRPDCPKTLAAFVHRMLEKKRERRPQKAKEVAHFLALIRREQFPGQWSGVGDAESTSAEG